MDFHVQQEPEMRDHMLRMITVMTVSLTLGLAATAPAHATEPSRSVESVAREGSRAYGELAVQSFARQFDVSIDVATERLGRQDLAYPLSRTLPEEVAGFSSLEFLPRSGTFVVRVASRSDLAETRAVLGDAGVTSGSRVEVVGFDDEELDAAVADLATVVEPMVREGAARVGVTAGRPVVEVISAQADEANRLLREHEVAVEPVLSRVSSDSLMASPASGCQSWDASCKDGLIVGGLGWGYSDTTSHCTMGFPAHAANNAEVFMTSGHCRVGQGDVRLMTNNLNGVYWYWPAGVILAQESHFGYWGDYAKVIPFLGNSTVDWKWFPLIAFWDNNAGPLPPDNWFWIEVGGAFTTPPPAGIFICGSGGGSISRHNRSNCGTVTNTNVTVSYGGQVVNGQMEASTASCPDSGHSGGPWVFEFGDIHVATAILSARSSTCGAILQPVNTAATALGLTIP